MSEAGSGDPDGNRAGVLIQGRHVRTIGSVECPPHRAAALTARGIPTPTLHELHPDEAGACRGLIGGLKEGNRHHAFVHDEQEYVAMRRFITDDGKTARTGASCGRVRPRHAHAHQ